MMIKLFLKRIFRNRWLLIKMYIVSPVVKILPVILVQHNYNDTNPNLTLNLCLWSFFYFSAFESVNMKMKAFGSEKINDVMLSRTSLIKYNLYENLALNIAFIPSYIYTLIIYSLIYHLSFNMGKVIVSSFFMILCNFLMMLITFIFELRFKNYFNKFNVSMDFIYILVGVTYSYTILPLILSKISLLIPITYIFSYSISNDFNNLIYFLFSYMICLALVLIWLNGTIYVYIKSGGRK